jgi:hypothetical protein
LIGETSEAEEKEAKDHDAEVGDPVRNPPEMYTRLAGQKIKEMNCYQSQQ